jgi:hypothetical protein
LARGYSFLGLFWMANDYIFDGKSGFDPKEFVLFFKDFRKDKRDIYKELRKKSGVYLFNSW